MKKAIIFDFFGVISSEVSPFWFAERFKENDALRLKEEYMGPADRGETSEEETFARLSKLTGENAEEIYADFCRRAVINNATVEIIEKLKENYKIILLSNAMGNWLRMILEKNSLLRLFDYTVISADEHIAKPDPQIFNIALLRAGVKPEEAIFIDDNKNNVDGAEAVGIEGIIFTDADSLRKKLVEKGLF